MKELINKTIINEFKANSIDMRCRIEDYAVVGNKPMTYKIDLFLGDGGRFISIRIYTLPPFEPVIMTINPMELKKITRYFNILEEAFNEIERKAPEEFN
ncbi:hypothetical protein [Carboxylicivirga caseinilyticus]|uniref:hypothetical protein n=1 Tax=Carboxylicivirga caseinilyticus TaxID=3417572 RepID=UPI003D3296BD|nr:hypothetical protein [Marinilabiliaceae bacterium A049]